MTNRRLPDREDHESLDYLGLIAQLEARLKILAAQALTQANVPSLIVLREAADLIVKLRRKEILLRETRKSGNALLREWEKASKKNG